MGAHRTGTTALQTVLLEKAPKLKKGKTGVLLPFKRRKTMLEPLITLARDPLKFEKDMTDFAELQGAFHALNTEFERFIISEENLLGGLLECFVRNQFYPSPEKAVLTLLEHFMQAENLHIILCIRNTGEFFKSLYGFRVGISLFESFDAYRDNLLNLSRSWFDVIMDLQTALPKAKITVFDYEVIKNDLKPVLKALGVSTEYAPQKHNASYSAEQIQRLLETYSPQNPFPFEERIKWRDEQKSATHHSPFQPWSKAEQAHFANAHQTCLHHIQKETRAELICA